MLRAVVVRYFRGFAGDGVSFLQPAAEIDQFAAFAAERPEGISFPFVAAAATRTTDFPRHRFQ